jgi:prepilin-type processing-associated H-X9-DG protein
MGVHMRDLLIRYLLGELDDREQRQLEMRLRESAELRRELSYLQACFSAANDASQTVPCELPPGLAERTAEQVAGETGESDELRLEHARRRRAAALAAIEPAASPVSWSLADLSVAAGVFLAVSMLLLPALRGSRDAARNNSCADALRQFGYFIAYYSDRHGNYLPIAEVDDFAGVLLVHLADAGLADRQRMARMALCPDSQQAADASAGRYVTRIPTLVEVRPARSVDGAQVLGLMNWSYGFPIGYEDGTGYKLPLNQGLSCKALMADAPCSGALQVTIANHGGRVNLLMADCHVKRIKTCKLSEMDDNPFLNADGEPKPGRTPDDNVLVPARYIVAPRP